MNELPRHLCLAFSSPPFLLLLTSSSSSSSSCSCEEEEEEEEEEKEDGVKEEDEDDTNLHDDASTFTEEVEDLKPDPEVVDMEEAEEDAKDPPSWSPSRRSRASTGGGGPGHRGGGQVQARPRERPPSSPGSWGLAQDN